MGGYSDEHYAASLSHWGSPRYLTGCDGWLLVRPIADFHAHDAMGSYPLFACRDWSQLARDLDGQRDLVAVSMVTDPFGVYDESLLATCFPDLLSPYKEHFVVDLRQDPDQFISARHQRNLQRSRKQVQVERCEAPEVFLEDWIGLYEQLILRHQIQGIARFSRRAFAEQFQTPGLVAFRATVNRQTVGMLLWYVSGDVAYYHLGAYSELGYQTRASFGLFKAAIDYFSKQVRWLSLGAGAGSVGNAGDGLNQFKRGWSTGTRLTYFCGRIFDHEAYDFLVNRSGAPATSFFPRYRLGDF